MNKKNKIFYVNDTTNEIILVDIILYKNKLSQNEEEVLLDGYFEIDALLYRETFGKNLFYTYEEAEGYILNKKES